MMVPPRGETAEMFDLSQLSIDAHNHEIASTIVDASKLPISRSQSDGSLPPLDSLTTESAAADDDSSVSTIGSTISTSRRSVFSKYWNATGEKPSPLTIGRRSESAPARPGQQRRSIISSYHGSYNSLPGTVQEETPIMESRNSASMGDLGSLTVSNHRSLAPSRSCLRKSERKPALNCSISEEDSVAGDSLASSVRFDLDATAVRHFTPPTEIHAEEGWDAFFH